jgi:Family of unknown function (DUF5677)
MDKMDEHSSALGAQEAGRPAKRFDFSLIKEPLEELPQMILGRLPPAIVDPKSRLSMLLRLLVHVSANTWDSVKFICRKEYGEEGRKVEFAYVAPPLTRTLFETLFTIIYVCEKPQERSLQYFKYGWASMVSYHDRMTALYSADPDYKEWLGLGEAEIEQIEQIVTPSADDRANVEQIVKEKWPTPGRMKNAMAPSPQKTFLEFLYERFYPSLSDDSHLSFPGLLRRGGHYLTLAAGVDLADLRERSRSMMLFDCLTIYVSLLTEISLQSPREDEKAKLRAVWDQLKVLEDAGKLYTRRYEAMLR